MTWGNHPVESPASLPQGVVAEGRADQSGVLGAAAGVRVSATFAQATPRFRNAATLLSADRVDG